MTPNRPIGLINIKELRLDLRLFYGYSANEVRKMSDEKVINTYKLHTKDIEIGGCKTQEQYY